MELTWANVDAVLRDCILDDRRDGAILESVIVGFGDPDAMMTQLTELGVCLVRTPRQIIALHRDRLAARRADVRSMILQVAAYQCAPSDMIHRCDGVTWGAAWQADLLLALALGLDLAVLAPQHPRQPVSTTNPLRVVITKDD